MTHINSKRGYLFEAELMEGMLLAGLNAHKIPDAKTLHTMTHIKSVADFIVGLGTKIITIEAKTTKLSRLPWANFRQHQIDWCLENPGSAYFVVNFNNRDKGKDLVNRTFLVSSQDILFWSQAHKVSIPLSQFEEDCIELTRFTGKHNEENGKAFIKFTDEVIESFINTETINKYGKQM